MTTIPFAWTYGFRCQISHIKVKTLFYELVMYMEYCRYMDLKLITQNGNRIGHCLGLANDAKCTMYQTVTNQSVWMYRGYIVTKLAGLTYRSCQFTYSGKDLVTIPTTVVHSMGQ